MIRAFTLALSCSLLVGVVACDEASGDPARILRLAAGSHTESEVRSLIGESLVENDESASILCAALDGLSDDQAVDAHVERYAHTNPTLELVVRDEKRAIQILREECETAGLD